MITRRSWFVYGTLLAIWVLLIGWQAAEHVRVRQSARRALRHRAEDISNTLAVIMRSQRRWGIIRTELIESAVNELVKQGALLSVELLNASNEKVASAGAPVDPQLKEDLLKDELAGGLNWNDRAQTLTLVNLVDLGTNIVMSTSEFTNRPPPPPRVETNEPPVAAGLTNVPPEGGTNEPPRR